MVFDHPFFNLWICGVREEQEGAEMRKGEVDSRIIVKGGQVYLLCMKPGHVQPWLYLRLRSVLCQ